MDDLFVCFFPDECSKRGYAYTWCTKADPSHVGTWSTTDYCTTEPDATPFGEKCADACEQRGEPYYWCHKVRRPILKFDPRGRNCPSRVNFVPWG
jgi:hypothetical protein